MQNQAMQMHREQSVRKGSVNPTAHFSSMLYDTSFHQKKKKIYGGQIILIIWIKKKVFSFIGNLKIIKI